MTINIDEEEHNREWLHKREAGRKKSLGEMGELLAIKCLVDNGYSNIKNLNDVRTHFPFADLYATKGRSKLVISVKARNKNMKTGKLNSRYKLGAKSYEHAEAAAQELDAIPCWMAVQFDRKSYSIWLGTLEELSGNLGISIRKCMSGKLGKCLVDEKRHYFDHHYFGN